MEDNGYGQRLCLKLGGTNERTSSKAELVEVQRANVRRWCAGMYGVDAMGGIYGLEYIGRKQRRIIP